MLIKLKKVEHRYHLDLSGSGYGGEVPKTADNILINYQKEEPVD